RLQRAFEKAGLDYRNYCVLLPRQDWISYLNLFMISDVFLDTLWWSGCNTTLEAIACGLPVVTLPGAFMRGRHSYAFLKIMGVTETIANDEENYVAIAAKLGLDRDSRNRISAKMIEGRPRLYEDKSCVSSLEEFYRRVVREHGLSDPTRQPLELCPGFEK
ncbi:MAG: glycosyltransferase, partial [candidate division NC10 bacterium]|nr:glycosyltransferase [candidate division NC10 bacterium]